MADDAAGSDQEAPAAGVGEQRARSASTAARSRRVSASRRRPPTIGRRRRRRDRRRRRVRPRRCASSAPPPDSSSGGRTAPAAMHVNDVEPARCRRLQHHAVERLAEASRKRHRRDWWDRRPARRRRCRRSRAASACAGEIARWSARCSPAPRAPARAPRRRSRSSASPASLWAMVRGENTVASSGVAGPSAAASPARWRSSRRQRRRGQPAAARCAASRRPRRSGCRQRVPRRPGRSPSSRPRAPVLDAIEPVRHRLDEIHVQRGGKPKRLVDQRRRIEVDAGEVAPERIGRAIDLRDARARRTRSSFESRAGAVPRMLVP